MTSPKMQPKTTPFAIRLTSPERAELERRAGAMALGSYIRAVLFADEARRKRRGSRAPVKDHVALAELLACLGAGRIGENLLRLAQATESGSLSVDDEVKVDIRRACDDIRVMRFLLMTALGFRSDAPDVSQSPSQAFARVAGDRS